MFSPAPQHLVSHQQDKYNQEDSHRELLAAKSGNRPKQVRHLVKETGNETGGEHEIMRN